MVIRSKLVIEVWRITTGWRNYAVDFGTREGAQKELDRLVREAGENKSYRLIETVDITNVDPKNPPMPASCNQGSHTPQPPPLNIGDVVVVKGTTFPHMTINEKNMSNQFVCVYFNNNTKDWHEDYFNEQALMLAPAKDNANG